MKINSKLNFLISDVTHGYPWLIQMLLVIGFVYKEISNGIALNNYMRYQGQFKLVLLFPYPEHDWS